MVNTLEGKHAIQRDLYRLERWARVSLLKFNKGKCNVLHMSQDNSKHKYSLSGNGLRAALTKRTWECC